MMSYNYGSNYQPMYNVAASGAMNPNEYSQVFKQHPESSSQLIHPNSNSYGQVVDKRGDPDMWRGMEKSSSSRNRSRTPERNYRSDRSSRRSRSRSRSPSRHRRRRSRSRSRSRERSTRRRSRSPRYARSPRPSSRRSPVESGPVSPKVILISLPVNTDKDMINIMIAKQGFHPIDIRVVRKATDSGSVRVFGFVEFSDAVQAQAWINYNKGHLVFDDGYMVKLEFSREIDSERRERAATAATPSSDWTCSKCTINNFNRRSSCFKCGTSRQDSEALEAKGFALVGVTPCDTLLIRELPASATEESVRRAMSQYTGHVIQRMQIAPSKSYALLQMKSMEDAIHVLNTFNKVVPYVDNCAVIVTFSRQSLNQILIMDNVSILKSQSGITSVNIHQDPINSAAQLAQNAMQMVQMGRQNISFHQHHDGNPTRQSISTPFGYLQSYPTPNQKSFQLEPVSGYFYDPDTAFYYDPKTEYYYNSKTNQWMFWSSKYSTYIPCEGGDLELKKRLQQEEKDDQKIRNSAVISAPPALASSDPAVSSATSEKGAIADALKAALEQNSRLMEALKGQLGTGDSNSGSGSLRQLQVSAPSFKNPPIPPSPRRIDDESHLIRQQVHKSNIFGNGDRFSPMEICHDVSFDSPLKRVSNNNSWRGTADRQQPSEQWRQPASLSVSLERDSRIVRMLPPPTASFPVPPPSVCLSRPPPDVFVGMPLQTVSSQVGFSGWSKPASAVNYPNNETHWSMSRMLENRIQANNLPVQTGFGQYIGNFTNKTAIANQAGNSAGIQLDIQRKVNGPFDGSLQFKQQQQPSSRFGPEDRQKKSTLIQKEQGDLKALNICFNCGGRNHQQFSCRFKRISDDHLQQIIARAKERLAKEQIMKQDLKKQAESYKCERKDMLIKRLRALAPHGKITKDHLRVLCDKCSMLGHTKSECSGKAVDSVTSKNIRKLVNDFSKRFFFHLMDENLIDFSKKFALFDVMDSIENAGVDPVKLQLESLCPKKRVTQKDLVLCSKCAQVGHKSTDCAAESVNREHYSKMLQLVSAYRALVKEHGGSYKLKPTAELQPGQKGTMDVITLDDDDEDNGKGEAKHDEETVDSDDDVVLVIQDEDEEMVLLEETADDDEDGDVDPTLVIADEENSVHAELEGGEEDAQAIFHTLASIVEEVADELDPPHVPPQQAAEPGHEKEPEGSVKELSSSSSHVLSAYKMANVGLEDSDDDIIFIS